MTIFLLYRWLRDYSTLLLGGLSCLLLCYLRIIKETDTRVHWTFYGASKCSSQTVCPLNSLMPVISHSHYEELSLEQSHSSLCPREIFEMPVSFVGLGMCKKPTNTLCNPQFERVRGLDWVNNKPFSCGSG